MLKAQDIIARINRSPRLIVVGYFWNDLNDDCAFPSLTVADSFPVEAQKYKDPKTGRLLNVESLDRSFSFWEKLTGKYALSFWNLASYYLDQHLILNNLINDWLRRRFAPKYSYTNPLDFIAFSPEPWVAAAWAQHENNLRAFKELAAAQGAELLVVLISTNTQVYPFLTGGRIIDLERPNRILGEFLRREQIRHLDFLPLFRRYSNQTPRKFLVSDQDLYWRANSHWSLKGERLAGLLVSRYVLENNLVQVTNRGKKLQEIEEKL